MRKLIVGAQVSMDGVMQAPGGPTEDPTNGFNYLVRWFYRLDVWLLTAVAAVVAASIVAAQSGVDMAKCLVVLILAPAIIVVGYEGRGYRYEAEALSVNAI